jgi:hypothetical protein
MAPFYTFSMGMSSNLEVAVQAVQPLPPMQNPPKLIAPSCLFDSLQDKPRCHRADRR